MMPPGGRARLESDGAELCLRDTSGARTGEDLGEGNWVAVKEWEETDTLEDRKSVTSCTVGFGAHEPNSGSDIFLW